MSKVALIPIKKESYRKQEWKTSLNLRELNNESQNGCKVCTNKTTALFIYNTRKKKRRENWNKL